MSFTIKDKEAESLIAEVAKLTGDNKTAAVRQTMRRERDRLLHEVGERHRPTASSPARGWMLVAVDFTDAEGSPPLQG